MFNQNDTQMKKQKTKILFLAVATAMLLSSCSTGKILPTVKGVVYHSMTATENVAPTDIPKEATIIVYYEIDANGYVDVKVKNNTDKLMVIDRTQSFFNNLGHVAETYYDPVMRTETTAITSGTSSGASVNLGAMARAAGIGGAAGAAMSGVNVGGSTSNAVTNTSTTYYVDQPRMSIPPHGTASMGRLFCINGISDNSIISNYIVKNYMTPKEDSFIRSVTEQEYFFASANESNVGCNICIAYSTDDGQHFETILNDIYRNCIYIIPVSQPSRANAAIRTLYQKKPDALFEPWYRLTMIDNIKKQPLWNPDEKAYTKYQPINDNFGNGGICVTTYR